MNFAISSPSKLAFLVRVILVTAIFAALDYFGAAWTRDGEKTSAIWLANAFVVAFLLRAEASHRIWFLVASFVANVAVLLHIGDPPSRAVLMATANVFDVMLMLALTARFCGVRARLDEFQVLLRFTAIAFAVPLVSGGFATLFLAWGDVPAALPIWANWAAAHTLGFVIATPIVVIAIDNFHTAHKLDRQRIFSWITLVGLTTAVSVLIFTQSSFPLLFLACPLVIFAAFLIGVSGTAASVAIISIIAISATLMGTGPISLVRGELSWSLLTLQLFLATNFLMGLPVAAVLAERNATKRDLDQSAKFTALITDNLSEVIFRTDDKGRWIYLNPAWEKLSGFLVSDWIGKEPFRLVIPADRRNAQQISAQLASGEIAAATLRQRFKHADGSTHHVDITAHRLVDDDGKFIGAVGNIRDVTEMVTQQDIIAASESRFRRIAESAPVGIFRADRRGHLTYINAAWANKTGMRAEDMMGNGWMAAVIDLSHFKDQPAWSDFEPSEIRRRTMEFHTPDGGELWMEIVTSAEFDSYGDVTGFVGVAIDVTSQKIASEQLVESERRFHALASLSPAGIFRTDRHGGYTYVNPAWLSLAGQMAEMWEDSGWVMALHPEDRAEVSAKWCTALSEAAEFRSEFRWLHSDGTVTWVDTLARPDTDEFGNVVGYVGVVIDITERHEVLEELALRDRELTLLAANATDGIFRLSLTGICKYASPSAHNLLGFPAGSLIDGNLLTGFHPDDRAGVEDAFAALRDGVKDHALVSYRLERMEIPGEYIWLEANCGLVRNAANEPSEIIASIRNISRRKAMEEELKEARKRAEAAVEARSAFMANMSHEIRTPMNGVIGFTEVLLAGELTEKQRRQIELIAESGRAMLRLLNDILDMSKIEAGQMTYAPGPVDLHHVLSSVARMMQPIAEAKGLKVDISVADALPEQIITDPLRFRQIILNLLSNAIKFTSYGHVRIAASKQTDINQQFLEITVEDSGIGMAADRLEVIFAPFMQAELDTSQRFGGTGLGLSISQELARLMGGEIAVTSQEGSGTTFTLKLPFEAYNSASAKAPPANEEKLRELLPELRVLVAEDNDINQQLMQDMATALGIQLEIACDGEGAIKAVRQAARARNSFVMVFMDLRMPGMGGLEATRRIRDLGYDADELPIIALTANAYQDDIDACKEAGMQGHLAKPLRLNDFKNEILKHCVLPADQAIKQLPLDQVDAPQAQAKVEDRYQERKRELFDRLATAQNKQSVSPSELEDLIDMLHKLAGTAGFFGEDELGQAAGELEQALRSAESGHIRLILEYPDLLSVGVR